MKLREDRIVMRPVIGPCLLGFTWNADGSSCDCFDILYRRDMRRP
jgi:hypothetical protein